MKLNETWKKRVRRLLVGGGVLSTLVVVGGVIAGNEPVHLTTDWSDRHVRFSAPKTLLQSLKLARDPRYVRDWMRKFAERKTDRGWWRGHNTPEELMHGDWNVYMGNVGTVGAGNYPAKYSFSVGTANCASAAQPDFVVYNTSLTGSATAIAAYTIGTFSGTPGNGLTLVITNTPNQITLTSSGATNTGLNWQTSGTAATDATNLANAINRNNATLGVTATANSPASGQVTITASTAGAAGDNITVTNNVTNFTFPFAGTTTNLVNGASGVATIVAFDNLYTGCTGTVPSPYWAYNTGTTGAVVTSPTLSFDGTQVAFVQSTGGAANLVLLKWAANSGTLSTPATPTSVTNANYRSCTAPCMTTIAFNGGATHTDTISSPFYDFTAGSDTMYVGDSLGYLHQFTGVFNGTPAETVSATAPKWPSQAATAPLSSPIYDSTSGYVYVNAAFSTTNNGGRLHSLCVTSSLCTLGTSVASGIMGPEITSGVATCESTGPTSGDAANLFMDAPIVDSANGVIYEFIGQDGTGNSAMYQFATNYASQSCGVHVTLGTGSTTGVPVYAGDLDNLYYSGSAGHMYVCGNAGGIPTLYQIPVPANGMLAAGTTATAGPTLATAAATCGPVVEIDNPHTGAASNVNKDWIFTSVQALAVTATPISCPTNTGCIMSFDVTAGTTITTSTATTGHTAVAGGASGIVLDNTVGSTTLTGASQIYFTPLATGTCSTTGGHGFGGCAIQASQSALQ